MSWAHVDRVLSKQGGSVLARLPNDMAEVLRLGFVMVCKNDARASRREAPCIAREARGSLVDLSLAKVWSKEKEKLK